MITTTTTTAQFFQKRAPQPQPNQFFRKLTTQPQPQHNFSKNDDPNPNPSTIFPKMTTTTPTTTTIFRFCPPQPQPLPQFLEIEHHNHNHNTIFGKKRPQIVVYHNCATILRSSLVLKVKIISVTYYIKGRVCDLHERTQWHVFEHNNNDFAPNNVFSQL